MGSTCQFVKNYTLRSAFCGSFRVVSPFRLLKIQSSGFFTNESNVLLSWTSAPKSPVQVAVALLSKIRAGLTSTAGADRRHSEAAVSWLCCHAEAGSWFPRDPARGQGDHPSPLDGAGAQDRYPFTGALCADFETGPERLNFNPPVDACLRS